MLLEIFLRGLINSCSVSVFRFPRFKHNQYKQQYKGNFEITFSHFLISNWFKMISFVWLFLDEIVDDISVRRRLCGHFCATAELQSKNVHSGGPFQLLRQSQFVDQLLPRFVSYRCFDVAGKIKLLNCLLLR